MDKRTLGARPVFPVGQGTFELEQVDRARAIRALRHGVDAGLEHVDTAELFGRGAVEEIIGEALEGMRDRAFIAAKVRPALATRDRIAQSLEETLRRLRTDHVDLYVLHWPEGLRPADVVELMEAQVKSGKTRAWGVARYDATSLRELVTAAGPGRVGCNQVELHLRMRTAEGGLVQTCADLGVPLVAYAPLGSGNFPQGKGPGAELLGKIARRHKTTPHAVALRFLLRFPHLHVVPRSTSTEHLDANAAAPALPLTDDEVAEISRVFTRS